MRLPSLTPRQVIKVLKQVGFVEARQTGSHLILAHKETKKIVPVPIHPRDLKRGLSASIIKQSGLTTREFIKLL